MNKEYEYSVFCGRFQVIHKGHEEIINTALKMSEKILILVGSSQESKTIRNPFEYETRAKMIKKIYPQDNVIVKPLADLTHEADITPDWGRYVLTNIKNHINKLPDILVYGDDEERDKWFDKEDIKSIIRVVVPRNYKVDISATKLREAMMKNNKEYWTEYSNKAIHDDFEDLRKELVVAYFQSAYHNPEDFKQLL